MTYESEKHPYLEVDEPADTLGSRIEHRLRQLGMTSSAAARLAGMPRDAIRDIIHGRSQNPRTDTLAKIAQALGVSPVYLLTGRRHDYPEADPVGSFPPDQQTLPIRYEVAAGRWLAHDDLREEPYGYETALRIKGFEKYPQWLERVRGDSMNKRIPDGALVHVIDAIALEYEPRHGDLVVVVRSRAQGAFLERSLKEVVLTPRGVELWPRSYNPEWDKPLQLTDGVREGDDLEVVIAAKVFTAYIPVAGMHQLP